MATKPNVILEGAVEVMAAGSSDAARASMRMVQASADLAHAELIHLFEKAQHDLVKELVRLKNSDLVTYHVDAALSRVKIILDKLRDNCETSAETMIHATIIIGRLKERLQQGNKDLLTAFDFIGDTEKNAKRLVEQLLGHLDRAITCTEQSVRNQIQAACVRANIAKQDSDGFDVVVGFPELATVNGKGIANPYSKVHLEPKEKENIQKNPVEKAREMTASAYKEIAKMRMAYVIGRREADMVRQRTLAAVATKEATGVPMVNAQKQLVSSLMSDGLTAFVDRSGRRWTLGNYAEMAVRTTSRQSLNYGKLFDDPEQDLFIVVDRKSNCPICSKYEGRVYSRSGNNPHYPALAEAFNSIDKNETKSLENSYLVIHPNCRHTIRPWHEITHTLEEVDAMRRKSNPATNPFDVDPRSKKQIEMYNERQKVMADEAASARMYRKMLQYIPVKELGSWVDFHRHWLTDDSWYQSMMAKYRKARRDKA